MSQFIKIWFFVGDLLLLNLAVLVSLYVNSGVKLMAEDYNNVYLLSFSNLAWLFLVLVSAPYNVTKAWSASKTLKSQIAFVVIHLLVVVSLIFFFEQHYSAFQVALIYILFIPGFLFFRVVTFYLRKVFTGDVPLLNYVLVGRNKLSEEIRRFYLIHPEEQHRFVGYLEFEGADFSSTKLGEFCAANDVHVIYCCVSGVGTLNLETLVNFGLDSMIKVKLIAEPQANDQAISLEDYDRLPGIGVSSIPLDEARYQFLKRMFDVVFAVGFNILVMSWLVILIAIAIKLDSRGPVFFVQLRSGKDNKPFKCLKFRTMLVNDQADVLQATAGDRRITKLGNFLRKTSIDELPQFFNVLIGSMSVVGPRPHMLKHPHEYSKLIDRFMGRHYIKPGVTGLAQCLGYRGETKNLVDMENRVRLDRYYIENWTFWLDIKIIFLTVVSLIRGSDKAY